jgi:hypothetical protein
MHNLSELRDALVAKGKKIKSFNGWCLIVGKDSYTMLSGEVYLNNTLLTKKELIAKINKK